MTTNYTAPLADIRFDLFELLEVEKLFARLPGCGELSRETVDAVLDCAGSPESLGLAAAILETEGALSQVGLMGERVELPLFPFVSGEKSYFGSFWGNYNDLREVLSLASQGLIKHRVVPVELNDINDNIEALGRGDIVGRAVVVFD